MKQYDTGSMQTIHDESYFTGCACKIVTPSTLVELTELVKSGESFTVQGALTGITGAAVPLGETAVSLAKFNEITYDKANDTVRCSAGVSFETMERILLRESRGTRFFPVSPTEKSATVGGALALGTTGLMSYKYGSVSDFAVEIEYIKADGELVRAKRGEPEFGEIFGSEGMLGIITEVVFKTEPAPESVWGILFFFSDDASAAGFADSLPDTGEIAVCEYMDKRSFELVSEESKTYSMPKLPDEFASAIYVQIIGEEDRCEECAERLIALCMEYGADPDEAWAVSGSEVENLCELRHQISECINSKIAQNRLNDSGIFKLSVDIKYAKKSRESILSDYRKSADICGVDYCIFGHIGSLSPYVNFIAKTADEYGRAMEIVEKWYGNAFANDAVCFGEHGVGKLRRKLFETAAGNRKKAERLALKQKYDSENKLNPHNISSGGEAK